MDNSYEFHWSWRSIGALVYFFICLMDLVAMPVYREWSYNRISAQELVEISKEMPDPASQIEAMQILKADRSWQPVTNEMFHLSFGAILGVAALNRSGSGFVRRKKKQEGDDDERDELGEPIFKGHLD